MRSFWSRLPAIRMSTDSLAGRVAAAAAVAADGQQAGAVAGSCVDLALAAPGMAVGAAVSWGGAVGREHTVAIVGNPNSGKTTVFNGLTGSKQRIGNWPGVTVERKEGTFRPGNAERILTEPFAPGASQTSGSVTVARIDADSVPEAIRIVDLPGI